MDFSTTNVPGKNRTRYDFNSPAFSSWEDNTCADTNNKATYQINFLKEFAPETWEDHLLMGQLLMSPLGDKSQKKAVWHVGNQESNYKKTQHKMKQ